MSSSKAPRQHAMPKSKRQHAMIAKLHKFAVCFVERLQVETLPRGKYLTQAVMKHLSGEERLVVVGMGNVGKSSFSNRFLGMKVWPVKQSCMTGRVCETTFGRLHEFGECGADLRPFDPEKGIPQEFVRNSNLRSDEAAHSLNVPLRASCPSEVLEPGIVLVDMPGHDQERAYIEAMETYMRNHDGARVVLVDLLDVNCKLKNSDRDFLGQLSRLWPQVSRRVVVVANKCDLVAKGAKVEDDEDDTEYYGELISEIKADLPKYVQADLFRMSLIDLKQGNEIAEADWSLLCDHLDSALAVQKRMRAVHAVMAICQLIAYVETIFADDLARRECVCVKGTACEESAARFSDWKLKEPPTAMSVHDDLQRKLRLERQAHREAIGRRTFRQEGETLTTESLADLEDEVAEVTQSFLRQDLSQVIESCPVIQDDLLAMSWAENATVAVASVAEFSSSLIRPASTASPALVVAVAAMSVINLVWHFGRNRISKATTLHVFDKMYDHIEGNVDDIVWHILHSMEADFEVEFRKQEECFRDLQSQPQIELPEESSQALSALKEQWVSILATHFSAATELY